MTQLPKLPSYLNCHFCEKPVGVADGFLELYTTDQHGKLRYPSQSQSVGPIVGLFSHAVCGPDTGYPIELERLEEDGVPHWIAHLSEKDWGCGAVEVLEAFVAAFGVGAGKRCACTHHA
jgi:hypothetical protein